MQTAYPVRDIYDHLFVQLIELVRLFLISNILFGIATADWVLSLVSGLVLITVYVDKMLQILFKITIPVELFTYYTVFVFSSLFLGMYGTFYAKFSWYDSAMHFVSHAGMSLAVFILYYLYSLCGKIKLSAVYAWIIAFSVSMTIGVLWEIFEFAMDELAGQRFGFRMQHGNTDTMSDFIFNTFGAGLVSTLGYLHLRGSKFAFLHRIVNKSITDNNLRINPIKVKTL